METLARGAGWLLIGGGAVMVVMLVWVAFTDPNTSPGWNLFWVLIALLGLGVLGLYQRTRNTVGQLGRLAAWVSALGALGLLLVGAYAVATNQLETSGNASSPLWPLWIVTLGAWLGGNVVFALTLIRARSLSPIGAWLVVLGIVVGAAGSLMGGANPPAALLLLFALFGIGWVVIGYGAWRQPAR